MKKYYKTLTEAFASIDYGMCLACKAEHEFPNVKCDLIVIEKRVMLENRLADIMNSQENGVESLVGLLSSLVTEEQLEALLNTLDGEG